jgi:hypothetical protein
MRPYVSDVWTFRFFESRSVLASDHQAVRSVPNPSGRRGWVSTSCLRRATNAAALLARGLSCPMFASDERGERGRRSLENVLEDFLSCKSR